MSVNVNKCKGYVENFLSYLTSIAWRNNNSILIMKLNVKF